MCMTTTRVIEGVKLFFLLAFTLVVFEHVFGCVIHGDFFVAYKDQPPSIAATQPVDGFAPQGATDAIIKEALK